MKRTLNKLIRGEKGQALIIVLILLLLGGLIIAPLLGFMSTGLKAGQVFEVKMNGLYAADAGIEDACWKLMNGEVPDAVIPFCNLTDVNGMDVEVIQLGAPVEVGDGTLYTLQSTACLAGETKAEIIAQVMVEVGTVGEGGEGGELAHNPDMKALSVINEYTIIFTTQQPNAEFWGREEDNLGPGTGTVIEPEDLGLLNIATGTGALYLDGDALGLLNSPKYEFNSVHYYHDGVTGNDYLLMSIKTSADVGTEPFNNSDIIRLQVDVNEVDPDHPFVQSVISVDSFPLLPTIPGANIVALSAQGLGDDEPANDIILFSMHGDATLGGTQFYTGEIIKYYPNTGVYNLKVDVNAILGPLGNPNLEIDCLAVLSESDPRLLLSFTVDPVTGSDGGPIKSQDVAIWDPGEDGIPNTSDDTINLHISMSIETWVPGGGTAVSIVSWEIS